MIPYSEILTALGVDHIRLAYHYADIGDVDGYDSLLDTDVEIDAAGFLHGSGRAQVLDRAKQLVPRQNRHHIHDIIADRHRVVVVGTACTRQPEATVEFADVFTLSRDALILRQRRYLAVNESSTSTHGRGIHR
ncbi:nuclear transport factor 2 family protein [Streptomyces sp. NPDC002588]|uniref:nuclear transport factor 2 family protein n=1 Tax=Streptomyces sp. NPDC002588 TaxID=3154419 RepID=UPI00332DC215